ncbi:unnamed protein product [Prunus armeniaca]
MLICLKADERDVYEFFSRVGKVRDVRLIMDRNSRRSKGVGYIEFYDAMSVSMAIAHSGQPLLGQPVMVKPSEAEKNLVQSTSVVSGPGGMIGPYSGGARRLYVGNLHTNIKEDDLRQVFGAFGPVELVQLPVDETNNCKGFGFVQFSRLEDARNALSLNGKLEIAAFHCPNGLYSVITVSAVTDQAGMQDLGANAGDFDDDEGGGLICLKADERDVYEFFSRVGKVHDVRLIMDRNSRRSKGVGYIEFYDAMSVPMAIALSGQPLLGQPVMVKPSEAEKNLVESTSVVGGPGGMIAPDSGGARRLFAVGYVFGAFGPVELVQLPVDETNNCKGFGFVQVSAVTDQAGMQDLGANAGDFDDDEGGGLFQHIPSRY